MRFWATILTLFWQENPPLPNNFVLSHSAQDSGRVRIILLALAPLSCKQAVSTAQERVLDRLSRAEALLFWPQLSSGSPVGPRRESCMNMHPGFGCIGSLNPARLIHIWGVDVIAGGRYAPVECMPF